MAFSEEANMAFRDAVVRADFRLVERTDELNGRRFTSLVSSLLSQRLSIAQAAREAAVLADVLPITLPSEAVPAAGAPAMAPVAARAFMAEVDTYLVKDSSAGGGLRSVGPVTRDGILTRVTGEYITDGNFNNASGVRVFVSARDASGVANPDPSLDRSVFEGTNSDTLDYPFFSAGRQVTAAGFIPQSRFDFRLNDSIRRGDFLTMDVGGFGVFIAYMIFEVLIPGENEATIIRERVIESVTERAVERGPVEEPRFLVVFERPGFLQRPLSARRAITRVVTQSELDYAISQNFEPSSIQPL